MPSAITCERFNFITICNCFFIEGIFPILANVNLINHLVKSIISDLIFFHAHVQPVNVQPVNVQLSLNFCLFLMKFFKFVIVLFHNTDLAFNIRIL